MNDNYLEGLASMASKIMNRPVTLSPVLETDGALRYIRLPLISPEVDFQIILNVKSYQLNEILLTFPKDDILQLRAEHSEREIDGFPVIRKCVYNFELPSGIHKDVLTALWTDDEFLIIQPRVPKPSSLNERLGVTRLVPQRIGWVLKNDLSMSMLKTLISQVEDDLEEILEGIAESTDEDSESEPVLDAEPEVEEKPEVEMISETIKDLEIKAEPKTVKKPESKEEPGTKGDLDIKAEPKTVEDPKSKEKPGTNDLKMKGKPEPKPAARVGTVKMAQVS